MKHTLLLAAMLASTSAVAALAADIAITDPYARVAMMNAPSGAAFMVIENHGATDDRLTAAASDIADKVELHTHKTDASGIMQMVEVPEGFVIPANGSHALARGGDHVMFLGLKKPLQQGDVVAVTLTFEKAGEIKVDVPVDMTRVGGMVMGMGGMAGMGGMQGMAGMQGMGGMAGMGGMQGMAGMGAMPGGCMHGMHMHGMYGMQQGMGGGMGCMMGMGGMQGMGPGMGGMAGMGGMQGMGPGMGGGMGGMAAPSN